MAYVMVDVEADGPIPGDYSMICFGAVIVREGLDQVFYGRLKPISEKWIPQALAVSGSIRATALPDVPTINEAGYPEATYNFWVGLFLPSKTPAPIMDRLYRETEAALQTPVLKERFVRMGADPLPLDRAGFAKMIQDEYALNTKVAKAAGVKAN